MSGPKRPKQTNPSGDQKTAWHPNLKRDGNRLISTVGAGSHGPTAGRIRPQDSGADGQRGQRAMGPMGQGERKIR